MRHDALRRLLLATFVLFAALALGGGACASRALCEKIDECADDPPGDDFVEICTRQHQASMAALRANEEEDCQRLADATAALDACRAQLSCDDFEEADLGGECDDEVDEYNDAFDDAADGNLGGSAIGPAGPGFNFYTGIPEQCSSFD